MLLKRIYKTPEGWEPIKNLRGADGKLADPRKPEGECLNPPPLDHIEVKRVQGPGSRQVFSTRLVDNGIFAGWISLGDGKITLHTRPKPLIYKIVQMPGHYCSHCGERQPGEIEARIHVKTAHPGEKSPDPESPAGYCRINAYICERLG